jgi:hypothetical protein
MRLEGSIKDAALNTLLPPRKLIAEKLQQTPKAVHALLNTENTSRNIRHIRHQKNKEPANPKTLEDLIIPERLRLMGTEDILKYDGWVSILSFYYTIQRV